MWLYYLVGLEGDGWKYFFSKITKLVVLLRMVNTKNSEEVVG